VILLPLGAIISIFIWVFDFGPIFFKQTRVGKYGNEFQIIKFRTMKVDAWEEGLLTIGDLDKRVTRIGFFLRKYKLDELPQFINVLKGEMSLVGPRPELPYFTDMYTVEQKEILNVLPGITDEATILYRKESEILANVSNPEEYYIQTIMPHKIELNRIFINDPSLANYFRIIFKTVKIIFLKPSNKSQGIK
jgi:lipopolysaccharide/colanic/teichoic acid biosynthesis glycosyltransferase